MRIEIHEIGPNKDSWCVVVGIAMNVETSCGFSVLFHVEQKKVIGLVTSPLSFMLKYKQELKKEILDALNKEPKENFS